MHFRTAADFKAPIRAEVEQAGYTILINMGDQPSDLEGGHAERAFLLPNPFYRVP
jgi:acid phosphatase